MPTNPESTANEHVPTRSPDVEAKRETLRRLLESRTFARSLRLQRFFTYTVEKAIEGRVDDIKEYPIALEVYGRDCEYDPRIDPIVRTEARRLRLKLKEYYASEGSDDPVRIDYRKGSYVPEFVAVTRSGLAFEAGRRGWRRWTSWALAASVVFAAGLAVASQFGRGAPTVPTTTANRMVPRFIVLPFTAFSIDENNDDFARAITESIIVSLVRSSHGNVPAQSTILRLRNHPAKLSETLARLEADYVIEGRVIRSGNSCRILAQLVRVGDETLVWADTFDFAWSELLEAQDTVSRQLAAQLDALRPSIDSTSRVHDTVVRAVRRER